MLRVFIPQLWLIYEFRQFVDLPMLFLHISLVFVFIAEHDVYSWAHWLLLAVVAEKLAVDN